MLGKAKGIFLLNDSDKYVGSYLSLQDASKILDTEGNNFSIETFEVINNVKYIDERILGELWKNNKIEGAVPHKKGNATCSIDEYILIALIKENFPNLEVEHQAKWGRKRIDLKVSNKEKEIFIEFLGPGHFTIQNKRTPENPFRRKESIESEFGIKCILWPYWIQRCKTNFEIVFFDKKKNGLGALWSTKVHFGQFIFNNSYDIIRELNTQFRIPENSSLGNFYEENSLNRIKPEHPIIKSISEGRIKDGIHRLLPKGTPEKEYSKWLPENLKN